MYVIRTPNVNRALAHGLRWLANFNGLNEPSRNGDVRVSRVPVMTVYDDPGNRVLFAPMRDANPFFHLMESLWMLAGRNDLPWLTQFNKQMQAYSDDGGATQPAAYGHRWRTFFGYDQLDVIANELRANPASRRCCLAMWNPGGDRDNDILIGVSDLVAAVSGSADVPCNTHVYFRINNGVLDMTVMCRSNDVYWGAYGANAVHFSVLLEYMAAKVGVQMGKLYQFSNNFHYYTDIVGDQQRAMSLADDAEAHDLYASRYLRTVPLVRQSGVFDEEVVKFCWTAEPGLTEDEYLDRVQRTTLTEPFLIHVAEPMLLAWRAHKRKNYQAAEDKARMVMAEDWRVAATEWLSRRALRQRKAEVA